MIKIKDFSVLDSKRTSGQSEFSNEEQFQKMLEDSQLRNQGNQDKVTDHLEEPMIVAHSTELKNDPSNESLVSNDNIRISEMLKQKQELSQIIDQSGTSHDKDQSTKDESILNEPAILKSSKPSDKSMASSDDKEDEKEPVNLIPAKVKQPKEQAFTPESVQKIIQNDEERQKLLDKLTNEIMKQLIVDCVAVPSRDKKDEQKDSGQQQQNHDIYLVD